MRMASVVGTALDVRGRPASGGTVAAVLVGSGRAGLDVGRVSIGSDGSFRFRSLPPGDYVFAAVTTASAAYVPSPGMGLRRLSIVGDEVATLTIQSYTGGVLSGRVVFEGETTAPRPRE